MSVGTIDRREPAGDQFCHEALLYRGQEEFLDAIAAFVREGVEADEPVLVVVSAPKIEALRRRLGPHAEGVCFADMGEVGRNPARIIPAWRDFVETHGGTGRPFRGVGEPIGPHLDLDQLVEYQVHEALLNVAFAQAPAWRLLCPYDLDALDPAVIDEACRSHPYVTEAGHRFPSDHYSDPDQLLADLEEPLPDPPVGAAELAFEGLTSLSRVRRVASELATRAGMSRARVDDLVVAVNEVATNSVRYGGGGGVLRMWPEEDALVCDVRDRGRRPHPLAGRERPDHSHDGGRGLWLVNQLCELVQMRSLPAGAVVRVHMALRD